MKIEDFNYPLPEERIAQTPPETRGTTRLLVLDRSTDRLEHRRYADFAEYVQSGDLIILNDTKVIKARLKAHNSRGQTRELLLLEDHHNTDFTSRRCLYRGSLKLHDILTVKDKPVRITAIHDGGIAEVTANVNLLDLAEEAGTVPLPPYMHREATAEDIKRYQTVFAKTAGSVAAPTASLNITNGLLEALTAKGATVAYLTLHVGLGTFLPIRTDDIEAHHMHSEYYEIPINTVEIIQKTRAAGGRIFAVGTTVARTLEFAHKDLMNPPQNLAGEANIFIYPGYQFKMVDALLTNFHAPKSTVLMMAAALAGWDRLKHAYATAVKEDYAFLSYGDSMLIL